LFASDVLRNGGNAVDQAIATMLCDSVACPDLTGVGGGFLMTVYNRTTGTSLLVNARAAAPASAGLTTLANRTTTGPPTGTRKRSRRIYDAVPGYRVGDETPHRGTTALFPTAVVLSFRSPFGFPDGLGNA